MPDLSDSTFSWKKILLPKFCIIIFGFQLWFSAVNVVLSQNFTYKYFSALSNIQSAYLNVECIWPYFQAGKRFLVINGKQTTGQDKDHKSAQNDQYYQKS